MAYWERFKEYAEQFRYTMAVLYESVIFIRKHRIWSGFWKYGWVARFLVVIAVILGLEMIGNLSSILGIFKAESANQALASMGMMMENTAQKAYDLLTGSSTKYILLILLEVLIYHACRRTLNLLGHDSETPTFNNFLRAQSRMFVVAIFAWAMNFVFSLPVKIFFGIFEFVDFLEPVLLYLIQSFFLGFAVMDNFNEQFGLKIKESYHFSKDYLGIGLAIGIVVNVLLYIPLLGVVVSPLLASVAVTLVMYAETLQGKLAENYLLQHRKKE